MNAAGGNVGLSEEIRLGLPPAVEMTYVPLQMSSALQPPTYATDASFGEIAGLRASGTSSRGLLPSASAIQTPFSLVAFSYTR